MIGPPDWKLSGSKPARPVDGANRHPATRASVSPKRLGQMDNFMVALRKPGGVEMRIPDASETLDADPCLSDALEFCLLLMVRTTDVNVTHIPQFFSLFQ